MGEAEKDESLIKERRRVDKDRREDKKKSIERQQIEIKIRTKEKMYAKK